MNFGQAISAVFNKYATFTGRARRSEYWWWALFQALLSLVTCWIPVINFVVSLGLFVPSLAVSIRRFHDIDRSGWFLLLPLAPLPIIMAGFVANGGNGYGTGSGAIIAIGGLALMGLLILNLVWFCTRGTTGANRFGPDPIASAEVV